ncbi:MAG: TM1812 family CRISPR-associated protein [Eubacteriales bacterium]
MPEDRVLITSLSVYPKMTHYKLNEKDFETNQAPLALMQLLPEEKCPQRILVLCSERILNEQFDSFREEIQKNYRAQVVQDEDGSIQVEDLSIPDGVTTEELWQSIQVILKSVPVGCKLTIDLTHGYRSFQFLMFMAALYLRTLKNVQIEGVYYGMLEVSKGESQSISNSVLVDMSVLINMIEWFYAAKIFSETGQAKYISELLAPFGIPPVGIKGPACSPYSQVQKLQKAFMNMGAAYLQALPLEAGVESTMLLKLLEERLPQHLSANIPLPEELFGKVKEFIEPFAMDNAKRNKDKSSITLNEEELKRQALMIDKYIEQGYVNHSIGLMREWMVSAAMFQINKRNNYDLLEGNVWLSYKEKNGRVGRETVEYNFGELQKLVQSPEGSRLLTQGQKWLVVQWQFLTSKRNQLHHHGLKEGYYLLDSRKLLEIKQRWDTIKASLSEKEKWDLEIHKEGN